MVSTTQGRPIAWRFVWKFAGSQHSLSIDTTGVSHEPPTLLSSSPLPLGLQPLHRSAAAIWHLAGEEQLRRHLCGQESIAEMGVWKKSGVGASWTLWRSGIPPECCSQVRNGYRVVVLERFFSPAKIWLCLFWSKSVITQSSSIRSVCLLEALPWFFFYRVI